VSENECKICEGKKEVKNPVDGKTVICFGCVPDRAWEKWYNSRDPYLEKLLWDDQRIEQDRMYAARAYEGWD